MRAGQPRWRVTSLVQVARPASGSEVSRRPAITPAATGRAGSRRIAGFAADRRGFPCSHGIWPRPILSS